MGAPPAQLALLREVVGVGPGDDVLSSALRRSGGDLAAAVNIIFDSASLPAPAPVPKAPSESTSAILLEDSDGEDAKPSVPPAPMQPPLGGSSSSAGATSSSSGGTGKRTSFAFFQQKAEEQKAAERSKKRLKAADSKADGTALETPPKAPAASRSRACDVEWALLLGGFNTDAFSTTRIGAEQQFRLEDGSFGPLFRAGARLELKWIVEAKKAKARPGTAAASAGYENGTVRFDVCGQEVGKFPSWAARALVPLLARRLIDVEAVLGKHPPRSVELGTTVPVVVRVSLRSSALSAPGKVVAASGHTAVGSDTAGGSAKSSKAKGQKAVQKEEADKEVQKTSTVMLLDKLQLPCRRRAAPGDEAEKGGDESLTGGAAGNGAGLEEDGEEAEEMSKAAAAQLGSRDHLERHDLPGVVLPAGSFGARLRPYQAQAVYWMWQQENPTSKMPSSFMTQDPHNAPAEDGQAPPSAPSVADKEPAERQLHPMWDEYELPEATGPLPGGRASAKFLYHHRTTGALSLDFPDAALAHCRGGVLADDMGLGKTVMCLALLSLDNGPANLPSARKAAPELRALEEDAESTPVPKQLNSFFQQTQQPSNADDSVGGVLVVAPLSLIRQWHAEAERHFPASCCPSVHEYHGAGRHISAEQLRNFGIVLTTYGTLSCEKEDGPLFQIYWRRIILDEAHAIKNRCSRQAQMAFRLRSFCRWCVTGTPLQNSVEELYSAVRFLRVDPWSAWPCWRQSVALPLERGRHGDGEAMSQALDTARRIVTPLILRRTKGTVDPKTGEPLLELPKKHVHIHNLQLSVAERDFYDALWNKSKTQFDTYVASGEALSKYTHILQLILKLRQALCHPFLVFAKQKGKDEDMESMEKRCLQEMVGGQGLSERFVGNLLEGLRNGELGDCPICCDAPEDPTITPCGHVFCRDCAHKVVKQCSGECPVCRKRGIDIKSLRVLPGASRFPSQLLAKASAAGQEGHSPAASETCAQSTKMKELLALLKKDMADGQRAVVFSQWTSFLDLVGSAMEAACIPFQRFDGSLSLDERAKRVAWLSEEAEEGTPSARVLMVSLKSGGSGLNLVAASRLYLLDLWWNPAVEEQAIQRVHRIGQKQEVHVYKFVVEDSIDMDLLDLHRAKERLLEDALQGGKHQEAATKLTMDDLKRLFSPCRSSLRGLRGNQASAASSDRSKASMLEPPEPVTSAPTARTPVPSTGAFEPEPVEEVTVSQADSDVEMNFDAEEAMPSAAAAASAAGGWRASMLSVPAAALAQAPKTAAPALVSTTPAPAATADAPVMTPPAPVDVPMAPIVAAALVEPVISPAAPAVPAEPAPAAVASANAPSTGAGAPAAWEAFGNEAEGSRAMQAVGSLGFFDEDDDLSDSEILAACEQAEEAMAATASQAVSGQGESQTAAAACWAAMPLDDA